MKRILVGIIGMLLVLSMVGCGETTPKHTLTFVESKRLGVPVNDEVWDMAAVYFNYTNNSGETCMPCDNFDVKAFQHGVELSIRVFTGTETGGGIQCDTDVQTGTTVRAVWLYLLEDDSTVSVECSDGQKFSFEVK